MAEVHAHIVTHNHAAYIAKSVSALCRQAGYSPQTLAISISDNASSDDTRQVLSNLPEHVQIYLNDSNLGFCAAYNQAVQRFLESGAEYFLVINPDVILQPTALGLLVDVLRSGKWGICCPKLYRADEDLQILRERELDSTGMYLSSELRHLDRGSGEIDRGQFDGYQEVFGASGAAMLLSRKTVQCLLLEPGVGADPLLKIHPQLEPGYDTRPQLFDEAFFAYREDADLAWRAQRLGVRCRFVPEAIGYHRRHVLPELRRQLVGGINLLSVQNRFLLQLNNVSSILSFRVLLRGLLFRNFLVLVAVFMREWTSIPALKRIVILLSLIHI